MNGLHRTNDAQLGEARPIVGVNDLKVFSAVAQSLAAGGWSLALFVPQGFIDI
jgi:hypothetical protein